MKTVLTVLEANQASLTAIMQILPALEEKILEIENTGIAEATVKVAPYNSGFQISVSWNIDYKKACKEENQNVLSFIDKCNYFTIQPCTFFDTYILEGAARMEITSTKYSANINSINADTNILESLQPHIQKMIASIAE